MNVRQSDEYQICAEFELWKKLQKFEFQQLLENKQVKLLNQLGNDVKDKHAELMQMIESTRNQSDQLVKKYKKKLISLEKRENQYLDDELNLGQVRKDLANQQRSLADDLRIKSLYEQEVLKEQLNALQVKIGEREKQFQKHLARINYLEQCCDSKDRKIHYLTDQDEIKPTCTHEVYEEYLDVKLQYNKLKDYTSKLLSDKERYRQKLRFVLQEISSTDKNNAPLPSNDFVNQFPILPVLPPVNKESTNTSENKENLDFETVKTELSSVVAKLSKSAELAEYNVITKQDLDTEVAKLVSERSTLLNTGVYMTGDFLIRQIDDKIKSLLASKS